MIRERLDARYPHAWRGMPVQMGYGRNNFLDFHLVIPAPCKGRPGLPVAIEAKAPAGALTKRQKETIRDLVKAGAMVFLVRDAADMERALRQIDAGLRSLCK